VRSNGAVALLIASRCFVEAVTFTALASLAHLFTVGRDPLPALSTTLMFFGVSLLLVTLLREIGGERRSATIMVITLAGTAAWGLMLPMNNPDGFSVLSRIVLFGLLGEAFLWRIVSIARGGTRWTDARNAVPFCAFAIAAAVLMPGPIDRAPFAALSLLTVAASGLALSLARTTEELALARGTQGGARTSSATSAMVVIGVVAIFAAALVPALQEMFGTVGSFLAPIAGRIFYLLILPFAYLAGWLIEFLRPLLAGARPVIPRFQTPSPEEDEILLRNIEQTRPYVFGAVELIVVAIAVLFAIMLLDRMLRERRVDLPEGVTLEREQAGGLNLRDTLRGLRPRRPSRRVRPREDGTPAAALRLLYWRFLALAEANRAGWRETAETPAEHAARISSVAPVWADGAPIVRAFEDLRYGELPPSPEVLQRARDAYRALETRLRTAS
jgi:hypothetical protein